MTSRQTIEQRKRIIRQRLNSEIDFKDYCEKYEQDGDQVLQDLAELREEFGIKVRPISVLDFTMEPYNPKDIKKAYFAMNRGLRRKLNQ